MARVFVSHAGDGVEPARQVHLWLVDEGHQVFLDQDRRDGIAIGDRWRERLQGLLR